MSGEKIYSTRDPIGATLGLADAHERVVLRALYYLTAPIRARVKLLPEGTFVLRNNDLGRRQLADWTSQGGILVNNVPRFNEPHDAQVFAEAPLSIPRLTDGIVQTGKLAVITRPLSWAGHEEAVTRYWPALDRLRRFEDLVRTYSRRRLGAYHKAALAAFEKSDRHMSVLSQTELCKKMGITSFHFPVLRRALMRGSLSRHWFYMMPVVPLIDPQDRSLLAPYRAIQKMPLVGGHRLILGSALHESHPNWRRALGNLWRCGSIERHSKLWFFWNEFEAPDYKRIDHEARTAISDLKDVVRLVEALPDYPGSKPLPPPPSRPARRRKPRSSSRG